MIYPQPVLRRLLLRRFAAGSSIIGTFLLPGSLHAAMTANRQHRVDKLRPEHLRHPPKPLIMLDPGHGGKDPGAIGVSGTFEKHVSLATALELRHQLEASGRYRVMLTRASDVFVPLDERVERAQQHGAALFVSMHADALTDHAVRGASVYTLSQTASDVQTAGLAHSENSVDHRHHSQHGRPSGSHSDRPGGKFGGRPEVARIMAALVRKRTMAESERLATAMVNSLDRDLPMLQHPTRHAGFVVLKAADIPSILVEMGFMSNARDEIAMRRPEHRRKVAHAMHLAVDGYFAGVGHMADGPLDRTRETG
jgi:N-acetylmuramoyl-L-alanine amidase